MAPPTGSQAVAADARPRRSVSAGRKITHGLTEIPSHTHANTLTDPGHTHLEYFPNGGGGASWYVGSTGTAVANIAGVQTGSSTTGITINNAFERRGRRSFYPDPISLGRRAEIKY